jgi:hypothetical protein
MAARARRRALDPHRRRDHRHPLGHEGREQHGQAQLGSVLAAGGRSSGRCSSTPRIASGG